MTDTKSVRVQNILDAAVAFNRLLDEQAKGDPPLAVRVEARKDRVHIVAIESNPQPETLWKAEEESDDG